VSIEVGGVPKAPSVFCFAEVWAHSDSLAISTIPLLRPRGTHGTFWIFDKRLPPCASCFAGAWAHFGLLGFAFSSIGLPGLYGYSTISQKSDAPVAGDGMNTLNDKFEMYLIAGDRTSLY
jgi:hypothetical protein